MTEWVYLDFDYNDETCTGVLKNQDGSLYCQTVFSSIDDAEKYLINNDLRASIL